MFSIGNKKIITIKPFINKYKWEGIHFPSEKDDWKKSEKYNVTIATLTLCILKNKKYILLIFQKITQIVKNKLFF